jgi:acyl-CoA synthetase (AMP-forming)/AMP-acid ligase II
MHVSEYLEAAARRHPHQDALVCGDERMSYRVLRSRAAALAAALIKLGPPGTRVGILCDNRPEYVESYYGVAAAGMVLTLLNQRLGKSEIAHIIKHSGMAILITERRYLPIVDVGDGPPPGLVHIVIVDEVANPPAFPRGRQLHRYDHLVGAAEPAGSDWPKVRVGDDSPAWLVYTSGTTGAPKGVVLSHRNLNAVVSNYLLGVPMRLHSGYLMPFPLCHVGGHLVFACAAVGARLVLQSSFLAVEFVDLVRTHRIETSPLAPTMLAMLMECERELLPMPSLRTLIYGSANISKELLNAAMRRFDGVDFIQRYGMTETSGTVTWLGSQDHHRAVATGAEHILGSCGRAAPLVDVRIVDEDFVERPAGMWGEVAVRGDQVMVGYWDDTPATENALRDGWLRTGDIGYIDDDGLLYIVDRKKDLVISGGENISSLEVERVLVDHPAVVEAAVVGVADPLWGQRVVAYVVVAGEHDVGEADIIGHCKSRLASFKKPSKVFFLPQLPRNALGKVLKKQLRADAQSAGAVGTV